jgi:hypothetical protein
MRSTVLRAPGDVRVEERDDPKILAPSDAIIRMSATACAARTYGTTRHQPHPAADSHGA